jgi:hypothetical protein
MEGGDMRRRLGYVCAGGLLFFLLACGGGATAPGLIDTMERNPPALRDDTERRPPALHDTMIRQPAPAQLIPLEH